MGANLVRRRTVVFPVTTNRHSNCRYQVNNHQGSLFLSRSPSPPLYLMVFDAHHFLIDAVSSELLDNLGHCFPPHYRNRRLRRSQNSSHKFYQKPIDSLIDLPQSVLTSLKGAPKFVHVPNAKLMKPDGSLSSGWEVGLYRVVSPTITLYVALMFPSKTKPRFPKLHSFVVGRHNHQPVHIRSYDSENNNDALKSLSPAMKSLLETKSGKMPPGHVYQNASSKNSDPEENIEARELDPIPNENGTTYRIMFHHSASWTICLETSNTLEMSLFRNPDTHVRNKLVSVQSFPNRRREISKATSFLHPLIWNVLEHQNGVLIADSNLRIISINQHLLRILGYNMSDLRYRHLSHTIVDDEFFLNLGTGNLFSLLKQQKESKKEEELNERQDEDENEDEDGAAGKLQFRRADHSILTIPCQIIREYPGSQDLVMLVQASQRENFSKLLERESSGYWGDEQDKESQLKAIIDTTADAIVTINNKGIIQNFNRAAELIFGYTADEVIGCNLTLLMPEPHASRHDTYIRRYLETGHKNIIGIGREVEALRKDGTRFPIELAVSEASFQGRTFFAGIMRDISARKEAEAKLEEEKQKTENLLSSILPRQIAQRLKHEEQVIADRFDDASVLFCDLVGFTSMSSTVSPAELVRFLNGMYSMFDQLEDHHPVTKIKTIGDAYMVVSGVPDPIPEHHAALADFALDMVESVRQFTDHVQVRIGIHSGPLVGGVIGRKQFSYDIWGGTVNVSSRMESGGVPGKIHVSERFYRALQDEFHFDERGAINVKGKGEMTSYFLVGRRHPRSDPSSLPLRRQFSKIRWDPSDTEIGLSQFDLNTTTQSASF